MDFTREPITETIVTPREGYKLVIRCSKIAGQEEHFVDSVEVVSFGSALFYRSQERPKCFLLPVSDYEMLEVREARMVFKNVGTDRAIKIAGGREGRKSESKPKKEEETASGEEKLERKRRRHSRRRRSKESCEEEKTLEEKEVEEPTPVQEEGPDLPVPDSVGVILPPPATLIRESIDRYKNDEAFSGAFFEEKQPESDQSTEEVRDVASEPEGEENLFLHQAEASGVDEGTSVAQEEVSAVQEVMEEEPPAAEVVQSEQPVVVEPNESDVQPNGDPAERLP